MRSTRVPPHQQLVGPGRWPLVGERAAASSDRPWVVDIRGEVLRTPTWTLEQLRELPQQEFTIDIHCVTRWSKLDVPFRGIRLATLLDAAQPNESATFISFVARSERQHSTSLPLAEALGLDAFLALEAEGEPLPPMHGGPVRMVVPGKYFYKSVKWIETIELLVEDRLGYWEADAGYHNGADPWLEQRYMAPTITKQQAARLIESRDFSRQDLRSIDASNRELPGLQAADAMLRDADFRRANLQNANFRGANLSNAHFEDADLRGADLTEADIEGTNFGGADLRGTNLRVASMFGASFGEPEGNFAVTRFDQQTQIDETKLDGLTESQKNYLQQAMRL